METDEGEAEGVVAFQLQFDKPIASQVLFLSKLAGAATHRKCAFSSLFEPFQYGHLQVKIAEWNPEKDLLAMVTDDSKLLLHRFNWQRLWTISPGFNVLYFFFSFIIFFLGETS